MLLVFIDKLSHNPGVSRIIMKYTICQNTYQELRALYKKSQPRIGYAEVTNSIIQGFILSKLVWTRNFFDRLKKSGGATNEIKARARNNLGRRSTRSIKKEAARLMGHRMGQINKEIRAQQKKCMNISTRVDNAFGQYKGSFITLKRREEARVW